MEYGIFKKLLLWNGNENVAIQNITKLQNYKKLQNKNFLHSICRHKMFASGPFAAVCSGCEFKVTRVL